MEKSEFMPPVTATTNRAVWPRQEFSLHQKQRRSKVKKPLTIQENQPQINQSVMNVRLKSSLWLSMLVDKTCTHKS
jgi:hypothetical protein